MPSPTPKLRSCAVCRSRKVRCDKQSPCSNCRRANIPCVFPASDRPPRWARRLHRVANNVAAESANPQAAQNTNPGVDQAIETLHTLEDLVKELTSQLEQARLLASSASGATSAFTSSVSSAHDHDTKRQRDISPTMGTANGQNHFGRLVLRDVNRSRLVSSGFWSRVIDEVCQSASAKSSLMAKKYLCSSMNWRWTLNLLPWMALRALEMISRLKRLHPPKNWNGRHQNAMLSSSAIIWDLLPLTYDHSTHYPRRYPLS